MIKNLGERNIDANSPEQKRAFEVFDIIVQKLKLKINSVDKKGYNILHLIAKGGNIGTFTAMLNKLTLAESLELLSMRSKKIRATPLVLLAMNCEEKQLATEFANLLLRYKT